MPSAKNFGYSLVATAPSPATSGTSLVVTAADGAKFPTVPFQATIWPINARPISTNAEIVTVTAISTDTLTIVRAQEDSSARSVIVGDQIAATITAGVGVQSNRFTPVTSATQNITLDGSTDFTVSDTHEVGAGYSLEVLATGTLEVVPAVKQAEALSYFGIYDFIESGCIWSADSAGSSLNGTMTDGYVWINGRRLRVNTVRSHAFTASKDTYIDFSDNGDGTAKVTYTENTNNLSTGSPTLAAGSLRNAIIVTAAGSIAASTSINQGQETIVVPIVSSIPYTKTDSLGNLICPRDSARRVLGYRQITANFTTSSTTTVAITGLSVPIIVPLSRLIKISMYADSATATIATNNFVSMWDGVAGSGTQIQQYENFNSTANGSPSGPNMVWVGTPSTSTKTYSVGAKTTGTTTLTVQASSTMPGFILVELV